MQNDTQTLDTLQTPCLLLDEARLRANVDRMKAHLAGLGVGFRPHLKTAKSLDVARIAMTNPEGPAMVSTLREAEYFAEGGVRDMVYGVGIAPGKLARVSAIRARGVDLAVILDSIEQAEAVAAHVRDTGDRVPVLIEVDADGHRSGISPDDGVALVGIGQCLAQGGAVLRGVLLHAGDSYSLNDPAALAAAAENERAAAVKAAESLRSARLPCPVVSVGSTPTARLSDRAKRCSSGESADGRTLRKSFLQAPVPAQRLEFLSLIAPFFDKDKLPRPLQHQGLSKGPASHRGQTEQYSSVVRRSPRRNR
jgi:D-serine deaminase-like pyridoxal phosphate-dependent protein